MSKARNNVWTALVGVWTIGAAMLAASASAQTRDTPPPAPRPPTIPPVGVRMGIVDPRDRPPTPQVGTASIRGRVVDGVTGRAIARARVRLMGSVQRGPALADDGGGFVFDRLPQGSYNLSVEKSTYLPGRYPEPSRSLRNRAFSFPLKDGQQLDDVSVPMFRGGVIAGRVVDAHGDPIEQVQISVLFLQKSGRPQARSGGPTNDLGEFRMSRLQPGRYVVRAQVMNMFQPENPGSSEPPLPQPLPVFYPSALSPDDAQVIVVNRGETVSGIDIMLAEGIPTVVSGVVLPLNGQPVSGGNVSFRLASQSEFGGGFTNGVGVRPDGSFRAAVAPGEYIFEARAQPPRGPNEVYRQENELFGSVRVSVAGSPIEGLAIPIGTGATGSGRIVFEGTTPPPKPPPGQTRVPLFNPDGPGCRVGITTVEADWTFKAEGFGGSCAIQPGGMFGRWSVKSVVIGGQNVADQAFTFESGQHYGNIRIVVTDKRTLAEVRVADESGQPTRDFVVLAFPADKERWKQLGRFVRTTTLPPLRSDMVPPPQIGRLQAASIDRPVDNVARLFGLSTGDYYVIAVDDMDPEDTQDPAILEKLIPSATRLSVTFDAPVELSLRRIPLAEIVR